MRQSPLPLLLILALVSAAGCASDESARRAVLDAMAADHQRYLDDFHRAQADVVARYPVPQRLEFPGHGMILLDECSLEGRPGKEYLRLHFTWVNTARRRVDTARVTLTLVDPETETAWSEVLDLKLPYGLGLNPNSSYTTWFEMPTRGLHLRGGWEWELSVEALSGEAALGQPGG